MFKSLRLQLTVWYLLFFSGLLCGFSFFLYTLLSRSLHARLDASLTESARAVANLYKSELAEDGDHPAEAGAETLHELRFPNTSLAIFDSGKLLASSDSKLSWEEVAREARQVRAPAGEPGLGDLAPHSVPGLEDFGAKIAVLPFQGADRECAVIAVEPFDSIELGLQMLRDVYFVALPAAILLAGLGGFFLASKSLSPLAMMSEQAEQIGASNLHKRLQIGAAKDELGRLARVFNELLSRLDQSFESMRQFIADAAHELRTPLAVIRGEAEVALSQERRPSEYRESLTVIQDEAARLSRLVDDLLSSARQEAGQLPLQPEEIYLNDLAEECCREAQTIARRKGVQLNCSCDGDILCRCDAQLIRRLLLNLLDNGARYTPAGGSVSLRLEIAGDNARIAVSDTGIGMPPEAVGRVFERFYRLDKARSRAEGGFGLGLAIVKWVAEAHQGKVDVKSQVGAGTTFTVLLPARLGGATVTPAAALEARKA